MSLSVALYLCNLPLAEAPAPVLAVKHPLRCSTPAKLVAAAAIVDGDLPRCPQALQVDRIIRVKLNLTLRNKIEKCDEYRSFQPS